MAPQAAPRGDYQAQDSALTLRQGLAEYYRLNPDRVTPPQDLPPESRDLFRRHDMCHVVFGLDTTLEDEGMVDARTLIGCDVGLSRYLGYLRSDQQAKALFAELGWARGLGVTIKILPRIVRAVLARPRMPRPWPWAPPESFLDRPLAELRRAFGIRVI